MNYMPDFFHVFVGRDCSLEALRKHFERVLCLSTTISENRGELTFNSTGGYSSINLKPTPKRVLQSIASKSVRKRVASSQLLEVVSGPNHYYWQYLAMFCDVKLAALRFSGTFFLTRDDQILELQGTHRHDAEVVTQLFSGSWRSLLYMLTSEESYEEHIRVASRMALELQPFLSTQSIDKDLARKLIEGLCRSEGDTVVEQLFASIPGLHSRVLVEMALLEEPPNWQAMALWLQQGTAIHLGVTLTDTERETLDRRGTSTEVWVRWAAAYVLGTAGNPEPMHALVSDPAGVQVIVECFECSLFYERVASRPDFAELDQAYWEFEEVNSERFTALVGAIGELSAVQPWSVGSCAGTHSVAIALWESLGATTNEQAIRDACQTIQAALSQG